MNEEAVPAAASNPCHRGVSHVWRVLARVALGIVVAAALVAVFWAYGQPELLLEQLNLRYCG